MEKVTHMELLTAQSARKTFEKFADIVCKNDLTFLEDKWLDNRTKRLYDVLWEIDGDYAFAINMRDLYDR